MVTGWEFIVMWGAVQAVRNYTPAEREDYTPPRDKGWALTKPGEDPYYPVD